jgi:hypothetical protein
MNRHLRRWLATVGTVVAVAGALLGSTLPAAAAGPTITSFTPSTGPVGTSVVITGTGFTGATAVLFGVTAARFTVASSTSIDTTVPSGALKGTLSVHTPSGNVTSKNKYFKVTPTLTSWTPEFGSTGTSVTISGTAFTGATKVTFDGVAASVGSVSYSSLTTSVPSGAKTGTLAVTTSSGTGTSVETFSVGTVFNVTTYGAVGNGTGDNTAAFAAAIAAAQTAGGGIVSVPAGTYTFVTGNPASIQIDGTVPITLAGAGRTTTKLVEMTRRRDLLSIDDNGTVVQDLWFDTVTNEGGHGVGDGADSTTVQRIQVDSGTETFGILYAGPKGAKPGDNEYSTDNVIDDVILDDEDKGDGFSFSFQKDGTVANIVHTGSRISLYADDYVTVTNYQYTPGAFGATAGWVISTPCFNITITNFITSGEGGQINNAPDLARVNTNITINGEEMTGAASKRILIGDVTGLLIENSQLGGIIISPAHIASGSVTNTTYTSVENKPHKGATDTVTFS